MCHHTLGEALERNLVEAQYNKRARVKVRHTSDKVRCEMVQKGRPCHTLAGSRSTRGKALQSDGSWCAHKLPRCRAPLTSHASEANTATTLQLMH